METFALTRKNKRQDDEQTLDILKLGEVDVEMHNYPPQSQRPALRLCSDEDTTKLSHCHDEACQLYMLGQFTRPR